MGAAEGATVALLLVALGLQLGNRALFYDLHPGQGPADHGHGESPPRPGHLGLLGRSRGPRPGDLRASNRLARGVSAAVGGHDQADRRFHCDRRGDRGRRAGPGAARGRESDPTISGRRGAGGGLPVVPGVLGDQLRALRLPDRDRPVVAGVVPRRRRRRAGGGGASARHRHERGRRGAALAGRRDPLRLRPAAACIRSPSSWWHVRHDAGVPVHGWPAFGASSCSLALRYGAARTRRRLLVPVGCGWIRAICCVARPFAVKAFVYLDLVWRRLDRIHPSLDVAVLLAAQPIALLLLAGSAAWALGTRRQVHRAKRPATGGDPDDGDPGGHRGDAGVALPPRRAGEPAVQSSLDLSVGDPILRAGPAVIVLLAFALAWLPGTRLGNAGSRRAGDGRGRVRRTRWRSTSGSDGRWCGRHDLSRTSFAEPRRPSGWRRGAAPGGIGGRPLVLGSQSFGEGYASGRLRDFDFGVVRASDRWCCCVLIRRQLHASGPGWTVPRRARSLRRPTGVLYRVDVDPRP